MARLIDELVEVVWTKIDDPEGEEGGPFEVTAHTTGLMREANVHHVTIVISRYQIDHGPMIIDIVRIPRADIVSITPEEDT